MIIYHVKIWKFLQVFSVVFCYLNQGKIKLTQQKFYRIQLAQEYHDSNHNA